VPEADQHPAAQLRRIIALVEKGRLSATSSQDLRLLRRLEGAVATLEIILPRAGETPD
jgi:hypothetical protein